MLIAEKKDYDPHKNSIEYKLKISKFHYWEITIYIFYFNPVFFLDTGGDTIFLLNSWDKAVVPYYKVDLSNYKTEDLVGKRHKIRVIFSNIFLINICFFYVTDRCPLFEAPDCL